MSATMTANLEPRTLAQRSLSPHSAISETSNERFPSFEDEPRRASLAQITESPLETSTPIVPEYRWPVRSNSQRANRGAGHKHRRSVSVSEALNNFRTRQGSVSENAHELAEALKAPISYKLIGLCIVWYMTSALTNTSSKSILNAFDKPATLTIIQFASVSMWCFASASLASIFPSLKRKIPPLKNGLRKPTWDVLQTALPLSVFQLLGHLLSSYATSKIPVSLVHTIKGLSPLFTVLAYRLLFRIRYKRATYLSLVPLTAGVMMACSTDFSANFWGVMSAFIAAIVFVTQNIFSKKLFTESARAEAEGQSHSRGKLDKLNLLCYCSVGAFLFSAPVWFYTEGTAIIGDFLKDGAVDLSEKKGSLDHGELAFEYLLNGLFHFFQNIMAFVLLSLLSPVSYSVASLIKRVWVIVVAVVWFRSSTTKLQVVGIALTCVGLYLYDRTSMEDAAERRTKTDHFRHNKQPLLPLAEASEKSENGHVQPPRRPSMNAIEKFTFPANGNKRDDSTQRRDNQRSDLMPPGTKQESTWAPGDNGP